MCAHLRPGLWSREKSHVLTCLWSLRLNLLLFFWGERSLAYPFSLLKVSPVSLKFCCRAQNSFFPQEVSHILQRWMIPLCTKLLLCKNPETPNKYFVSGTISSISTMRPWPFFSCLFVILVIYCCWSLRKCASAEYLNRHVETCRCWPLVGKVWILQARRSLRSASGALAEWFWSLFSKPSSFLVFFFFKVLQWEKYLWCLRGGRWIWEVKKQCTRNWT